MANDRNINIREVQRLNRARVLNMIRSAPSVPRIAISETTGLSPATVTNIVAYLIRIGLVKETGTESSGRVGRRSVMLNFDGRRYRMISVYCINNSLQVCLIDLQGSILRKLEYPVTHETKKRITSMICEGIETLLEDRNGGTVIGIGAALSALVLDDGRFVVSSELAMDGIDLRTELEKITDIPVFIRNITFIRARWLCRAETKADRHTLYIDMENGIGASLLRGGERVPGVIGEIGYMSVESESGRFYDGSGRLESICSPERLLELYREKGSTAGLNEFAADLAAGNKTAREVLEICAGYLGRGIAGTVNMFDPAVILINNADYSECPIVVERACEIMRSHVLRGVGRHMELRITRFRTEELSEAIAFELCSALFAASFEKDIFEFLDTVNK